MTLFGKTDDTSSPRDGIMLLAGGRCHILLSGIFAIPCGLWVESRMTLRPLLYTVRIRIFAT